VRYCAPNQYKSLCLVCYHLIPSTRSRCWILPELNNLTDGTPGKSCSRKDLICFRWDFSSSTSSAIIRDLTAAYFINNVHGTLTSHVPGSRDQPPHVTSQHQAVSKVERHCRALRHRGWPVLAYRRRHQIWHMMPSGASTPRQTKR
jgi:hypothetical protein